MEKERGFTLIELLVVLAVLAILFGVAALALSGTADNAEQDLAPQSFQDALSLAPDCDACRDGLQALGE